MAALERTESRGAHQRRDFPEPDPAFDNRHVRLVRDAKSELDRIELPAEQRALLDLVADGVVERYA